MSGRTPVLALAPRAGLLLSAARVLAPLIGGALLSASASAALVSLAPDRDNTLFEYADGSQSSGAGPDLFAGRTRLQDDDGRRRRAVLRFPVSAALPEGARITGARLSLSLTQANALSGERLLSLHRLTNEWGEGLSDSSGLGGGGAGAPATEGDATWLHRLFPAALWDEPGGDFQTEASAAAAVGIATGRYTWEAPGLLADVRLWAENPETNLGWILIGDEAANLTARRFASREHPDPSLRPLLEIEFVIPEPSAGLLLLATFVSGTAVRHRRAARRPACGS